MILTFHIHGCWCFFFAIEFCSHHLYDKFCGVVISRVAFAYVHPTVHYEMNACSALFSLFRMKCLLISSDATPLHQSRVLPKSAETRSPESAVSSEVCNPEPVDNGKLLICMGYHDGSKYGSSSSVRELLDCRNPVDAQSELQMQGIVGYAEDIDVEVAWNLRLNDSLNLIIWVEKLFFTIGAYIVLLCTRLW